MADAVTEAARAICIVLARLPPGVSPDAKQDAGPASERGQPMWKYYEPAARAAVEAIDRAQPALSSTAEPLKETIRQAIIGELNRQQDGAELWFNGADRIDGSVDWDAVASAVEKALPNR